MKKDLLNTVLCLGIMFLVGGCVMITIIIESNKKIEINNKKDFYNKQKKDSVNVVNTDLSGQQRSGLPKGSGGLQNAP